MTKLRQLGVILGGLLFAGALSSQTLSSNEIRGLLQAFKSDPRGPYQAIRWFCPDGTVLPANQRCEQPGGIQHALHKDVVQRIAREQKIYLGQILAGTPFEDFFDRANGNSRLKQYQLEQYLQAVDDGWILRKARYYRGAFQIEDEEAWGLDFLQWLLAQDSLIVQQFFLVRQVVKEIPHRANDNRLTTIRALSKNIADTVPEFMDIRVKIHGQPEASDLERVRAFRVHNLGKIPPNIEQMLQKLENEIEEAYRPDDVRSLVKYAERIPGDSPINRHLRKLVEPLTLGNPGAGQRTSIQTKCRQIAELLWVIRQNLLNVSDSRARVDAIDLSHELERILYKSISGWSVHTFAELFEKNDVLAKAAAGAGFLEIWEWQQVEPFLSPPESTQRLTFGRFSEKAQHARRVVEWGTSMVHAVYGPVVGLFKEFEPLATAFLDERIRSSILLPLGETAIRLTDLVGQTAGISNYVMGIKNAGQVHGLNPGFALGELQVVPEASEGIAFSPKKIYILPRAPTDLKPIAGIASVSAGNLVSHVQLLARNLGIPNAVLSEQNLRDLLPYHGQMVFYAISPRGAVIMKPAAEMSADERALFRVQKRAQEKVRVPIEALDLNQVGLIRLSELRAKDSGKFCGPKAAHLGQLKHLFPEHVVEGLVIPFGVFRNHMEQTIESTGQTLWQFLQETFRSWAGSEGEGEQEMFKRLAALRQTIKSMPLRPEFQQRLRDQFYATFGAKLGELPVFIRSDTNMEDLKDFTGAGLNLTVFNVVDETKIFDGIRQVWASPFTERSYRWRQKFLLNPENVYPSILILPTVSVEKSGVMITSGISGPNSQDVTVAFNRGPGGAVEGQKAESYLISENGKITLLSPSREVKYTILSKSGEITKGTSHFDERILTVEELRHLYEMADEIRTRLPHSPGVEGKGPFDVELGFKGGKIILFQVRPFVENKRAQASLYLRSLDPHVPKKKQIAMDEKI